MLKFFAFLLVLALLGFLVFAFLHTRKSNRFIKDAFKNHNVIVFGAKGKGKDLLFQKAIYLRKKEKYLSNITYGYNGEILPVNALNIDPNTYQSFIDGSITKLVKEQVREGIDYYMSDGGIHLPSQCDHELHKKYPSFPLYYALSRHLYNQNIHINTQSIERLWKAVREQADKYIKCLGKVKIGGIMVCKVILYDKYQSALNGLLPLGSRFLNKFSKAESDQYYSTNGDIQVRYYILLTKHIKYDTRHFEKVVFKTDLI